VSHHHLVTGTKVLKTASSQPRLSFVPGKPFLRRAAWALVATAALASLGACGKKDRPKADIAAAKITTIGVNSYLWRASLETLSFMPLLQTDSNGGVIVTDWYVNPSNAGERMKLSVTILDEDLRADALRVAASRQVASGGGWVESPVDAATVQKLEDVILTKARDLRRSAVAG
jgi:predicted small lipoprotein YifL